MPMVVAGTSAEVGLVAGRRFSEPGVEKDGSGVPLFYGLACSLDSHGRSIKLEPVHFQRNHDCRGSGTRVA